MDKGILPWKTSMNEIKHLRSVASMVNWRELRTTIAYCPICDTRRLFIRLRDDEIASRCIICRASAISLSIVSILRKVARDIHSKDIYELSSRGPVFQFLKSHAKTLTSSEFFSDVAPGEFRGGVQCQDVQHLTYGDKSFDICTSTEVFEHVPDDSKAFSETLRVLRTNGILVFTVPLSNERETLERAVLTSTGKVRHFLPPEYHGDPIRDSGRILAFRTYGQDIIERLRAAGFVDARIVLPEDIIPWGYARRVVVASKGAIGTGVSGGATYGLKARILAQR
jgi:SAM-dependent methyltransferase